MWHLRSPVTHTFALVAIMDNSNKKVALMWGVQGWNDKLPNIKGIAKEKLEANGKTAWERDKSINGLVGDPGLKRLIQPWHS